MKKGYARVSSVGQNLDRQIKQLEDEGCEFIYEEKLTGTTKERPVLQKMLEELEPGDEVIITDLTRLARSRNDLFWLVDVFKAAEANLKSLKDPWLDIRTDNPYTEFLFTIMSGLSQLEVRLLKMRQAEGIAIAKEKGNFKGRPHKFNKSKIEHAIELYKTGQYTIKEITDITTISKSTFYRRLKQIEGGN